MKKVDEATNNLSYQIIGAAMEVHRTLEAGLLESVYEEAFCIELEEKNLPYERQKDIGIVYKGRSIGNMRADIIVDNHIIVELKAVERLQGVHDAQILTYLKITQLRLGLLINFNSTILKNGIKRVIL